MDKFEKCQMNRKLSIMNLHEKMRDLYEEERLALFYQEMFTPEMDTPLRTLELGVQELDILESYGIWLLSDVLVLGWQHNEFIYVQAKKSLSKIKGIGPKTIDVLMQKICEGLTSEEKRQRVAELAKESRYPECDKYHFHRWAKRLSLQYEEVKQIIKRLRHKNQLNPFKKEHFKVL